MKAKSVFPEEILSGLKESKGFHIRAGMGRHRFIGLWFVVVKNRIFIRSWSVKPTGWYRKFLVQPRGAIQVGKIKIAVCAMPITNKSLRDVVDRAYLEKYSTGWEQKYAKDLVSEKSRATTVELVPYIKPGASS